jgi:uncharacterized protein
VRIAIIGSGIAGLTCAHLLSRAHEITLFEREERPGGHAHTHEVSLAGASVAADSGFLVYNVATYPLFIRLLDELGVPTQPSDMSFSVSDEQAGLEWCGSSPGSVLAQPRNLLRPRFVRMLLDVVRFNRLARRLLDDPPADDVTLAAVLEQGRWSRGFLEWYLVPLGSSIWSADPATFTQMPAATFLRFFDRHGLLRVRQAPAWRTITGGSRTYVERLLAPLREQGRLRLATPVRSVARQEDVAIETDDGLERFDQVVLACHSDQALSLLADPSAAEAEILSAIGYQENRATLHTDTRLLPTARRAWASWNYQRTTSEQRRATLTYQLNRLQGFDEAVPLLVTLNQDDRIDPGTVIASMDYQHPVFDPAAIAAQARRSEIQGVRRTWYCGAYWGYGFHEDGVRSAVEVCEGLGVAW